MSAALNPLRHRTLNLLTAGLGALAFCAAEQAGWLALITLACLIASHALSSPTSHVRVPRLALNIAVATIVALTGYEIVSARQEVISSVSEFLVLILCVKLFDRQRVRDEAQLLGLGVFVAIGAVLTNNSLPTGVLLLSFTICAIVAFVLLQISAGEERNLARARDLGVTHLDPLIPAARRRHDLRAVVAVCIFGAIALGVVGFVVTPRNLVPNIARAWGDPRSGALTGFAESIRLGQTGLITEDTTPVMDVVVSDGDNNPARPDSTLYLRGAVLDRYNTVSGSWDTRDASEFPDGTGDSLRTGPGERVLIVSGNPTPPPAHVILRQEITIRKLREGQTRLFAAFRPIAIASESAARVRHNPTDGVLIRDTGPAGPFTYVVVSQRDFIDPLPRRIDDEPATRAPNPFAIGPINDLARSILAGPANDQAQTDFTLADATDIRRAARSIEAHLRERFAYSLRPPVPPRGVDPIEFFLFQGQRGHCEYFASAMAALCLSVGIEARVITGYAAGEFNPVVGHFTVRQSDAHAWVEVRLAPGRWETFDPTPPASLSHQQRSSSGLLGFLRQLYDAIEFTWIDNVVTFDQTRGGPPEAQRLNYLISLRSWLSGVAERVAAIMPAGGVAQILALAAIVGVLTLVTLAIVLLARAAGPWLRRFLRARSSDDPDARLTANDDRLRFYPQMLLLLRQGGLPKPRATPPLAFADQLRALHPSVAEHVRDLSDRFYAMRFGGRSAPQDHARAVESRLDALRQALADTRASDRTTSPADPRPGAPDNHARNNA
jgi:transglutaminase-like putative cysteine protease